MLRSEAVIIGAEANQKASEGQYYSAVELYTKAISYYPFDYRFHLNRAFCYERLELYHLALTDSEEALRQRPEAGKCHFRKARALFGLKDYTRAERTYRQVLAVSPDCEDVVHDLWRLRCQALMDMGFDGEPALHASQKYESIDAAVEGLLSNGMVAAINSTGMPTIGGDDCRNGSFDAVVQKPDNGGTNRQDLTNNSRCDTGATDLSQRFTDLVLQDRELVMDRDASDTNAVNYEIGLRYADKARDWAQHNGLTVPDNTPHNFPSITTSIANTTSAAPVVSSTATTTITGLKCPEKLLKPTNIWGYYGLRVENVCADNRKAISRRFGLYGRLKAIEPKRNSRSGVYLHYDNADSPVAAIAQLQGTVCTDVSVHEKGQPVPMRLYFAPTNDQPELKFCRPKQPADNKGECYYWRTTYCSLDDKCPLLHIAANKHIDAQVWMKSRDGSLIC